MMMTVKKVMLTMTSLLLLILPGITSAPNILRNPPLVLSPESSQLKFKEGETVRMDCPVFSQPQAIVSWFKDGSPIHQGWLNFRAAGIGLRIKNVTEGDGGWYTCLAVNGFGSTEVRMHLEIISDKKRQTSPSHLSTTTNSTTLSTRRKTSTSAPPKHTSTTHTGLQNQEIYVLIATGLIFSAVAVCLIILTVLIRLTCGSKCRREGSGSKDCRESSRTTTNEDYISSSASLLYVSSNSSLENNHKTRDQITWSPLDAATLAERNSKSEILRF